MSSADLRYRLSPEHLFTEAWTRHFARAHLDPRRIATALDVGVGAGGWVDWLGHWLAGHGTVTALDIDETIVRALDDRQRREGHPNPARAIHGDLMRVELEPFDLVSVLGSTIHETHAPIRAVRCAMKLVRPGGCLLVTLPHALGSLDRILHELPDPIALTTYDAMPEAAFSAVLTRRALA